MSETTSFRINEHEISADLTIDVYPADPSVGIMYGYGEIVECEVTEFNEFRRSDTGTGCDQNWSQLDAFILTALQDNEDLHREALENADSNQEWQ